MLLWKARFVLASLFPVKLQASLTFWFTLEIKKTKQNAAFKSALVSRPRFKCFEPGPAVKMNGGFSQSQMMENPIVRKSTQAVSTVWCFTSGYRNQSATCGPQEPLLHNKRDSPCQISALEMSEIFLWLWITKRSQCLPVPLHVKITEHTRCMLESCRI